MTSFHGMISRHNRLVTLTKRELILKRLHKLYKILYNFLYWKNENESDLFIQMRACFSSMRKIRLLPNSHISSCNSSASQIVHIDHCHIWKWTIFKWYQNYFAATRFFFLENTLFYDLLAQRLIFLNSKSRLYPNTSNYMIICIDMKLRFRRSLILIHIII
jgi:hypothetical protein